MPPRRFWAALALLAAPCRLLLRSNARGTPTTTPAAAQNQGKSNPVWARAPTTRNYKTDGGWRLSARGAAGAVAFGAFWSCSALPTRGSSAGRARVLGALLAFSPHLAAARPFGRANTSVVTRRKLGYVMYENSLRMAVAEWLANPTAAEAKYGHISTWETGGVTDMSMLFCVRQDWMDDYPDFQT